MYSNLSGIVSVISKINFKLILALCCYRLLFARCWRHHIFRTCLRIMGVPAPSLLGELHLSQIEQQRPTMKIDRVRMPRFCLYLLCRKGHKSSRCGCSIINMSVCCFFFTIRRQQDHYANCSKFSSSKFLIQYSETLDCE